MSKTIVAASTPTGGAVAMVRMSGENSHEYVRKLCNGVGKQSRTAYFATAKTDTVTDKCIVILYDEGKSYTGEKCAEIFCHGSKVIVSEIIKFLINLGAVTADRGEFTLRAYRNKKIDLTEAEGILDLINSETVEQAVNAYNSVDGKLANKIRDIQNELKKVIAAVEVAIDYPEENVEEQTVGDAKEKIKGIIDQISVLTDSYADGMKIKNGIKVVISGKPNVGKSSIFNALLGYDRAIVNKNAGTTRDVIESEYVYKGRKFVLTDTAGIRDGGDETESEGIERAFAELKDADLIIGVGVAGDEYDGQKNAVAVSNKSDEKKGNNFAVSALTGEGIAELKELIYERTDFDTSGLKLNNLRQYEALSNAKRALIAALNNNRTADCFSIDLTEAYDSLGKVTNVIGSDEIIAEIFSAFCVGK